MAKQDAKPIFYLLEDDPVWVSLITGKYAKRYTLKHFERGEDLIAALPNDNPEIVLLDHQLPASEMTGLDTLKEVKKIKPKAPCIMLSGQENVQVALDVLEHGAYDYVVKNETSSERLKIIFRNLRREEELKRELFQLTISVKRWKLGLYVLVAFTVVLLTVIYLYTCPENRALKWDPFGRVDSGVCLKPGDEPEQIIIPADTSLVTPADSIVPID